jgi:hypothetical protein
VAREAAAAAANAAAGARADAEVEQKARSEESSSKLAAKRASAPPPPPPASASASPAPAFPYAQSRSDSGAVAPVDQAAASGSALGGLSEGNAKPAVRKPATWLTEIRSLRDQGRIEKARAALIEFRKKYPKWVIPTDLAPLLKQ